MNTQCAGNKILHGATLAAILAATCLEVSAQPGPGSSNADIDGVWRRRAADLVASDGGNVPFQPWAKQVFDRTNAEREAGVQVVDNRTLCLPDGGVDVMFPPYLYQVIQASTRVHILAEFNNQMRTIYLDVAHPADLKPSWYGYSVGHWEGDTLVVDTIGFNDRSPLMTLSLGRNMRTNIPHTDALHVVERYTVSDDGSTLTNRMMIDDPGAFTEPWTFELAYTRLEDERLAEFVCADDARLLDPDNPPDLEGLITVGAHGKYPLDLDSLDLDSTR